MVSVGWRLRCRRSEADVQASELDEDEGEDEGEDGGNSDVCPCCGGPHKWISSCWFSPCSIADGISHWFA
jgi:hypothetical protein